MVYRTGSLPGQPARVPLLTWMGARAPFRPRRAISVSASAVPRPVVVAVELAQLVIAPALAAPSIRVIVTRTWEVTTMLAVILSATLFATVQEDASRVAWIEIIPYEESSGELRRLYELVKGASGNVDNVVKVHSLRPHTLEGHYTLYKSVLHHPDNETPAWFLEALGVYTSLTNGCDYSFTHHFEGLRRALGDDERAEAIRAALADARPEAVFEGKELALLRYARKLTRSPAEMTVADFEALRRAGATDEEILEANQIIAYFNYANRVLNGLGVTTKGDVIGTSPRTGR